MSSVLFCVVLYCALLCCSVLYWADLLECCVMKEEEAEDQQKASIYRHGGRQSTAASNYPEITIDSLRTGSSLRG